MEKWLIKRAAESRVLVLPNGAQVSGADLESRLEGLMNLRQLLQIVERRLGIGLGFFSLAYSLLGTVLITRLVMATS